jgi:hypothetical protein
MVLYFILIYQLLFASQFRYSECNVMVKMLLSVLESVSFVAFRTKAHTTHIAVSSHSLLRHCNIAPGIWNLHLLSYAQG